MRPCCHELSSSVWLWGPTAFWESYWSQVHVEWRWVQVQWRKTVTVVAVARWQEVWRTYRHNLKANRWKTKGFFFSYFYLFGPPLNSSVHILCVSSKFNWTFQEKFLPDTPRELSVSWCQRQLRWKPRWTITQIKSLLVLIRRQELLRYSEK